MEVKLRFQLSPAFLLDTASALLVKGMQGLMQILFQYAPHYGIIMRTSLVT